MAGHIGPASFTPFPAGAKQLTSIILHRIKAATSLFFCLFFFPRLRHSSGSSRPLSLEPLGRHANTITPGYLFPSTHTTDQIITLVPFSFLFLFRNQISRVSLQCCCSSVYTYDHLYSIESVETFPLCPGPYERLLYMFIRFVINTIINIYIDRAVGGGAKRVCCDTHNANSDVCECVYI